MLCKCGLVVGGSGWVWCRYWGRVGGCGIGAGVCGWEWFRQGRTEAQPTPKYQMGGGPYIYQKRNEVYVLLNTLSSIYF